MELTERDYELISDCFPKHRGNVRMGNLEVLNALLYVVENGCKWRRLPERFGNWHSVYMRVNRWAKSGVLAEVFAALQSRQLLRLKVEAVSLDSTSIKVHPDGTGALKKTASRPSGRAGAGGTPSFIWLPQMSARR